MFQDTSWFGHISKHYFPFASTNEQSQDQPKMVQESGPKKVEMAKESTKPDLFARVRASVGTNLDPSHTNAATSPSLHVDVSVFPLLSSQPEYIKESIIPGT